MSDQRGSGENTYFCLTCRFKFALHTCRKYRKGSIACPACWEAEHVRRWNPDDPEQHNKRQPRRSWTTREEAALKAYVFQGVTSWKSLEGAFNRSATAIYKHAVACGYIQARKYKVKK